MNFEMHVETKKEWRIARVDEKHGLVWWGRFGREADWFESLRAGRTVAEGPMKESKSVGACVHVWEYLSFAEKALEYVRENHASDAFLVPCVTNTTAFVLAPARKDADAADQNC